MAIWTKPSRQAAQLQVDERVYAIGDVHGEAALLERVLVRILADSRRRGPASTRLVLLGDVIDRGRDSAALLRTLTTIDTDRLVLLKGNHEAAFVDCYGGDEDALIFWLEYGGRSTLAGFGIDETDIATLSGADVIARMRSRIDRDIVDRVDRWPTSWTCGDYAFVHAGIRPGLPLDRQEEGDLIWIREPFLSSPLDHGHVVVHGHTIEPGVPTLGGNRIGLDTGAHEHRRLTGLGLEDGRQWLVQVDGDAVATAVGAATFDRIRRLIAAIVADVDTRDAALLLLPEWRQHGLLRAKGGWARPTAALAAAMVVGIFVGAGLYRGIDDRRPADRAEITVPAALPAALPAVLPAPSPVVAAAPQAAPVPAPPRTSIRAPVRVAAKAPPAPVVSEPVAVVRAAPEPLPPEQTVAVHLTGAALERALEEDRILTRRLNEAELDKIERRRQR